MKYVRVMDGTVSNESGLDTKINEVVVARDWDPSATTRDTIKGINFSTDDSILRWIRRGDTIYDVVLPEDALVKQVPGNFTPHGLFRTNKIILTNPRPLTEKLVYELYKIADLPERTWHDVLAILAIRKYDLVCDALIKERINKDNYQEYLQDYLDFAKNDIHDNVFGNYHKYKEILLNLKDTL